MRKEIIHKLTSFSKNILVYISLCVLQVSIMLFSQDLKQTTSENKTRQTKINQQNMDEFSPGSFFKTNPKDENMIEDEAIPLGSKADFR
jgi:UDP-N-acetylenolpyruvoylglucosamine reductase